MQNMPDFVLQLERMSGLPWWCLLLLAALVLIILILAVSLSREKRRNRVGAVDIPRGTTAPKAEETPAAENAEEPAEHEDAPGDSGEDAATVKAEPEEASEEAVESPIEDEPAEAPVAEEPAVEPADDPDEFQHDDEADAVPAEDSASEAVPEVEVLDESIAAGTASYDLEDGEIFKATGGSHSRVGQSAFGIDFGFLEEYEADYEHALEEFRRLRGKTQEEDK